VSRFVPFSVRFHSVHPWPMSLVYLVFRLNRRAYAWETAPEANQSRQYKLKHHDMNIGAVYCFVSHMMHSQMFLSMISGSKFQFDSGQWLPFRVAIIISFGGPLDDENGSQPPCIHPASVNTDKRQEIRRVLHIPG
jgi:hypothetical protein